MLLHHDIFHQLHQHFGVGVRLELHTFLYEFLLDVGIILNDAVMDDGQAMRLGKVRMGIAARRLAMSSPARMGDTYSTTHILITTIITEVVNLTLRLKDIQCAVIVNQRNASTIVTTIFQSSKTFDKYRKCFLCANISYYSAHIVPMFVSNRLQRYNIFAKRPTVFRILFYDCINENPSPCDEGFPLVINRT